ncbi:PmoA family protein [Parabacteroides johnsonii]|uniref:DUF6807 domain-containing protein n=1 Tax=Parabacteroides johnsonii TaxID=387661 RepID=UPI003AB590F1
MKNVCIKIQLILFSFFIFLMGCSLSKSQPDILIQENKQEKKIDVVVDGNLFTSYRYSTDFEKPFLFPIYSPNGSVVTRGYPLEPRKGERVDHPHHTGLWFNHGNVNGLDFWNNSSAIKDKEKYGHIVVTKILDVKDGKSGLIKVLSEWRDEQENVLLEETTEYIIHATDDSRTIDHISTLKAIQNVTFTDNKEGMIAIRVDRSFEEPTKGSMIFIDEHGNPTEVKTQADNIGVNGVYYSSNGFTGGKVWSTRNDWVLLTGEKDGSIITFGFFDHPDNVGYPFHSHARGYGLFACNNLGSHSYNKQDDEIVYHLIKGDTLVLKHRFHIEAGKDKISKEQADAIGVDFSKSY